MFLFELMNNAFHSTHIKNLLWAVVSEHVFSRVETRETKFLLLLVLVTAYGSPAASIENPGFENGWRGWKLVNSTLDETAISDVSRSGKRSGKITGSSGRFEQRVEVAPDFDYTLSVYIRGNGTIGVVVGDETWSIDAPGDGDNWVEVLLPFAPGPAREILIFATFIEGDVRFDDFALSVVGAPDPAIEPNDGKTTLSGTFDEIKKYQELEGSCRQTTELNFTSTGGSRRLSDTQESASTVHRDYDSARATSSLGETLKFDTGAIQVIKEIGVSWQVLKRKEFELGVASSLDGDTYEVLFEEKVNIDAEADLERYDFDDRLARYLRITSHNSAGEVGNNIADVQIFGCGPGQMRSSSNGDGQSEANNLSPYGLKTNVAPSENFDLADWKLTLPVDRDQDGRADEISELMLADGWSDPALFYTDPVTGGMVFRTPQASSATTLMSKYRRTELREMLRAGDLSIDTRTDDGTPNENNWVLPEAPPAAQARAGGVGGVLRATLAVNQVTRLGDPARVGRVIIGQIHSKNHEPLRLYYRKLPTNKFGSIYYAHETADKREVYFDIIGDRGDFAPNPPDGIALDELFSYEIIIESDTVGQTQHPFLKVKIIRDNGSEVMADPLDLIGSGYLTHKNFLYFKAGVYSQNDNNSWQDYDADQVTFYKLDNSHKANN